MKYSSSAYIRHWNLVTKPKGDILTQLPALSVILWHMPCWVILDLPASSPCQKLQLLLAAKINSQQYKNVNKADIFLKRVVDKIKGKKKRDKYTKKKLELYQNISSQSKSLQSLKIFAGPEEGFSWFLAPLLLPYLSWDRSLWRWRVALQLALAGKTGQST